MLFFALLKNQPTRIRLFDYCLFCIFLLILLFQAFNISDDFRGPFLVGTFIEPFTISLFLMAFGGMLNGIVLVPICAIYYCLLINSALLIVKSRWWIAVLMTLPVITIALVREYNLEYERAYYQSYRDKTSIEECVGKNKFEILLCEKIINRNIYEKTHIEHCRTLGYYDYSSCISDVASFKKDVAICKHLNQGIALKYTGSSNSPYLRDCVARLSIQENLTSHATCNVFDNPDDFDECLDFFVDRTKDFSLCGEMKQERSRTRCGYYKDQYFQSQ